MQREISSFFKPSNKQNITTPIISSDDLSLKRKRNQTELDNHENNDQNLAKPVFKSAIKQAPKQSSPSDSSVPKYDLPEFITPEKIRDKNLRRPGDPDYDPTTLFVPPKEQFTPAMDQYWKIKSDHWDKIVLFKLGKFYELFYQDAIVAQQILELKWMGNDQKKAHVGFPEKALEKNGKILVEKGLKVVVVEQTETTLKNRKQKLGKGAVGREVTDILTKATYTAKFVNDNYEPTYLLAFIEMQDIFGVCFVECSTSVIVVGEVDLQTFKTILVQSRPAEIIYHPQFIMPSTLKLLKNSAIPPQLSKLKNVEN